MRQILTALLFLFLFSACGEYEKLLKSTDHANKYKKAIVFFNDKEFAKAEGLIKQILPVYRGTSKAQSLDYYYAFCFYEQKQYLSAAYYFKNFITTYPNSPYAEECRFMKAVCEYKESPKPMLDQTLSKKAIESLQLYINRYPKSTRIEKAHNYIDELENKLVYKSYLSAKNYFDRERYKSAIIALQNSLQDYPNSKYREKELFMLLQSRYQLAKNSIQKKKIDRYNAAKEEYYVFIDEFPESKYKKEANKYLGHLNNYLDKIITKEE